MRDLGNKGLTSEGANDADEDAPQRSDPGAVRSRMGPHMVLARIALHASLDRTGLRRLRSVETRLAVVGVPGTAWKQSIAQCARTIGRWNRVCTPSPKRRGLAPDLDPGEVAEMVALGRRVLIVSEDLRSCIPTVGAAADVSITVRPPSDDVVRRTIAAVTKRRVPSVPPGIAQGLRYEELVACIRTGTTPEDCVSRLVSARRAATSDAATADAPDLAGLVGYGSAHEWCLSLVSEIAAWRLGKGQFPRGARAVFAGPPGTGKSTLIRAVAKAAELPMVDASLGRAFASTDGHLGDVIRAMQSSWDAAKSMEPCLLVMDELDSIPDRARLTDRAREWWTPVVNHLLTSIDAVTVEASKIVILGATNFGSALDAALLRPGRLERVFVIELPQSERECEVILRHHLKGELSNEDLGPFLPLFLGLSGAEIMGLVADAAQSARSHGRPLALEDLAATILPPERRAEGAVLRCAIHEAGHAVGALAVGHTVESVSIVERGDSEGKVSGMQNLLDMPTRRDMEDLAVAMLCGTAAEEVLLGSRSIGAGGAPDSDLGKATAIIAAITASYGLGASLAFRSEPSGALSALWADPMLRRCVEDDLARLYARACGIIEEREADVRRIADELRTRRYLTGSQVVGLVGKRAGTPLHPDTTKGDPDGPVPFP